MQHAELVTGIKKVSEALEQSGLREALAPSDNQDTELLLDALRRYAIAASSYTSAEETVADLLGLSELDSSSAWARLLSGGNARAHFYDRIGFVTHHLPRFVELLEESAEEQGNEETFCVTAVGDGGRGITCERLVTIVNSLTALYRGCAEIDGFAPGEVALVSCDAGNDTLLWFEGEPEVLASVRSLLTSAFRWLALYREQALEERIERARDELPAIDKLHQLVMDDEMDLEVASALEQEVLIALLAFFDAGALIPEMEEDMARDPREIVQTPMHDVDEIDDDSGLQEVTAEIEQLDESLMPPGSEEVIELEPGSVEISDEASSAGLIDEEIGDEEVVDDDELEPGEEVEDPLVDEALVEEELDEMAAELVDEDSADDVSATVQLTASELVAEPTDDGVLEVDGEVVEVDALDVESLESPEVDDEPEIKTEGPWVD